jgi:hypothetical protein
MPISGAGRATFRPLSGGKRLPNAVRHPYHKTAERAEAAPADSSDMFANGSAAMCNLADKYDHGLGVRQDYAQAQHWYSKSAAPQQPRGSIQPGQSLPLGQGRAPRHAAGSFGALKEMGG